MELNEGQLSHMGMLMYMFLHRLHQYSHHTWFIVRIFSSQYTHTILRSLT